MIFIQLESMYPSLRGKLDQGKSVRGGKVLKIIVDGTPEELAAFVAATQKRQDSKSVRLEDFEKFIRKYQESSSQLEFA